MFLFVFFGVTCSAQCTVNAKEISTPLINITIPPECIYYACMYAYKQITKVFVLHILAINVLIISVDLLRSEIIRKHVWL